MLEMATNSKDEMMAMDKALKDRVEQLKKTA
jgi:hypothetical protein